MPTVRGPYGRRCVGTLPELSERLACQAGRGESLSSRFTGDGWGQSMVRRRFVGVLALAAALSSVAGCTQHAPDPAKLSVRSTSNATESTVANPVPLSVASARTLETQARSGDDATVKTALAVPANQKLDPALVSGLAAMKSLTIEQSKFRQVDDLSAVVPITTVDTAGKSTTWTATLVLVNSTWRIGLTDPAGG